MQDNEIIRLLFERSEAALDELKKKYAHLYRQIIRRTLRSDADAEECENDLLLAVWNSVPPQKPQNFAAYVAAIARRLSAGKVRTALREKREIELREAQQRAADEERKERIAKDKAKEKKSDRIAVLGILLSIASILLAIVALGPIRRLIFKLTGINL